MKGTAVSRQALPSLLGRLSSVLVWLPAMLFVLWLVLLAVTVWKATATNEPPVYDAIGYAAKAKNFWAEVHSGGLFNPLEVEPTLRPPGTILVSYPFGFEGDIHAFFFRTVFIPASLLGCAFLIAGRFWQARGGKSWTLLSVAIVGTTLPAFYQTLGGNFFVGYWGLVDTFIGSLAAVAVAAILAGSIAERRGWLAGLGLFVAIATAYVKPAGAVVFVCAVIMYALLGLAHSIRRRSFRLKSMVSGIVLIGVCTALLLPARFSSYISDQHLESGKLSVAILRSDLHTAVTRQWISGALFHVLGWVPLFCFLALVGIGLLYALKSDDAPGFNPNWLLGCSAVWMAAGILFLAGTDLSQVRYVFPFLFPALVCGVAAALPHLHRVGRVVWLILIAAVVIQVTDFLATMAFGGRAARSGDLAGWYMKPSPYGQEVRAVRDWLRQTSINHAGKIITLYDACDAPAAVFISSAIIYDAMVATEFQRNGFYVAIERPVNWKRKSGLYANEIEKADFILANRLNASPLERRAGPMSLDKRLSRLNSLMVGAPSYSSGLTRQPIGNQAAMLEVRDRNRFRQWFEQTCRWLCDESDGSDRR
jgi:hypothetical protein